ncbi:MAG: chaperone modulator CbpM [Bacteroidales bacterium]|nr:chaperone modulator CbpM [Bacteroidales bacterium]
MNKGNMIPANEFCASHNIEITFINSLQEAGLIEVTTINETEYIHESQLNELEKIVRLYYELDINLEGIETVTHLLQRINDMQDEIMLLKNRLRLYESFE